MDTTYHNVWGNYILPNPYYHIYTELVSAFKANHNKYLYALQKASQKAVFLIYMCIVFSCNATRIPTVEQEYTEKYTLQQQLIQKGYYDIKNVYNLKRIHL